MKPVTVGTVVDRPREQVFAFLDRLANHEAFTDHFLKHWHVLSDDRVQVSTGRELLDITVVERVPPERLVERAIGAHGRRITRGTYRLTALQPSRTDVRFEIAFEKVPLRERIAGRLLWSYMRHENGRAMERLHDLLDPRPNDLAEATTGT